MANVMFALPNIGGALCSTPQSLADTHYWAKVHHIVGHVEEILLLNKIFPIVDTCLSCKDIARQSCATVPRWQIFDDFLRPVFAASRVQHVSDLHLKCTLRPHHVCKYGRHPICDGSD